MIDHRIEAVRGVLSDGLAQQIRDFWSKHVQFDPDEAAARLAEVVCVVRDPADDVVGVNSVHAAEVPAVADRVFWLYRCFLAPGVPDDAPMAMVGAAFDVLAAAFEPPTGRPVGLCWFVRDRALLERHPAAVWPENGLLYAGWGADGRQIRLRYFHLAEI